LGESVDAVPIAWIPAGEELSCDPGPPCEGNVGAPKIDATVAFDDREVSRISPSGLAPPNVTAACGHQAAFRRLAG
jgi:hypothetical protein